MRVVTARSLLSPLFIVAMAAALLLMQAARSSPEAGLGDSVIRGVQSFSLPISFAANHGQADESVAFVSQNAGFDVSLTGEGPVLSLPSTDGVATVGMGLLGANRAAAITPGEQLPGTVNNFMGSDSSNWLTNIPTYRGVTYESVYPGIDMAV